MSKDNSDEAAPEVGYKKPPRHSQFKKGHKGHGGGRRKKTKSSASVIAAGLSETLAITVDGKRKKVEFSEAFVTKIKREALMGDKDAQRIVASWMRELEKKLPPGQTPQEIEAHKRDAEHLAAYTKKIYDMFDAESDIVWYMLGYWEDEKFHLFAWVKEAAMKQPAWLAVHLRANEVAPDPPHIVEHMRKLINREP